MKRFWGHVVAGLGLVGSAFAIFSACAHDDSSIFIRAVLAPPQTANASGQCTYSADPTGLTLSAGQLDVAFSSSYTPALLIGNQLQARASTEQGRTETSRVAVQGVIVRITDDKGSSLHDPFTRTANGFLDPGQGGQPTYSVIFATVMDHTVTDALIPNLQQRDNGRFKNVRLMAYIKAFGTTLGGVHVETNETQFPVDVCYGCLVSFPAGVSSPFYPQPNCAGASTGTTQTPATPCVIGQDQPIDCRLCTDRAELCKPPVFVPDGGGGDSGSPVDSGNPVDAGGG